MNTSGTGGPARVELTIPRALAIIFAPFACGFFLSYILRSVNQIISPQLIADIGLPADDLGLVTSSFFITFALFQIPLGVLLDRFGPRRVHGTVLLFAAAGALLFGMGESRNELIAARALIGFGMAGGLMASLKAITLWFPRERWQVVNGCFFAIGGLGAMTTTQPVVWLLENDVNWRELFFGLAALIVLVSLLIWTVVPERRDAQAPSSLGDQARGLGLIFTDRFFWRLAPVTFICMSTGMAIGTLWGGRWLIDVAGFSQAAMADYMLVLGICMTLGWVSGGFLADFMLRRGLDPLLLMGGGTLLFIAAVALMVFEVMPDSLLPWILFGGFSNMATLSYAILSRHFPLEYAARANTTLNALVFGGVFLQQYVIGGIIARWPETATGYAPDGYPYAFGIVLALMVVSWLWFLVPDRTRHAQPMSEPAE